MNLAALIKLLLALASSIAQYIQNKQLMEAGAAVAVLKGIEDAKIAIDRADVARNAANSLPRENDPNNRDNIK